MATNNRSSNNNRQQVQRSNSDSARWIAGLVIAFVGLYLAASVFFSFLHWEADQSGLQLTAEQRETIGVTPDNMCGWAGAWIGLQLVDRSFGLFGLLLPIIILLLGVRIIRQKPLVLNQVTLSLLIVMLLGSLTLGFAFGTRWSLIASTGWGGDFGIEVARLLKGHIGGLGTTILLVGGWILTGVFINRNFINTVNEAGLVVVDKSGQLVERVLHRAEKGHTAPAVEEEPNEEPDEEYPFIDEPAPQVVEPSPVPTAVPEPSPFEVVDPAASTEPEQVAEPIGETPAEVQPASPFVEIDTVEDRLVMGRSGLVELTPRRVAQRAPRSTEEGFVEIDLNKLVDPQPVPVEPIADPAAPAQSIVQPEPTVQPEEPTGGVVVTVEVPE
ncbi:MAG: DNA translocase FtsK 4TM domain-containing protein, partial [Alistipes sp.]|nr:DNA translocase FtsK 4TM domain-containing protein [Alistipes sp.]